MTKYITMKMMIHQSSPTVHNIVNKIWGKKANFAAKSKVTKILDREMFIQNYQQPSFKFIIIILQFKSYFQIYLRSRRQFLQKPMGIIVFEILGVGQLKLTNNYLLNILPIHT